MYFSHFLVSFCALWWASNPSDKLFKPFMLTNSTFGRPPNHRTHAESLGVANCSGGLTIFPGHAGWPLAEPQTNSPIQNPDVGEFDVGEDSTILFYFKNNLFSFLSPAPQFYFLHLILMMWFCPVNGFWIMDEMFFFIELICIKKQKYEWCTSVQLALTSCQRWCSYLFAGDCWSSLRLSIKY